MIPSLIGSSTWIRRLIWSTANQFIVLTYSSLYTFHSFKSQHIEYSSYTLLDLYTHPDLAPFGASQLWINFLSIFIIVKSPTMSCFDRDIKCKCSICRMVHQWYWPMPWQHNSMMAKHQVARSLKIYDNLIKCLIGWGRAWLQLNIDSSP